MTARVPASPVPFYLMGAERLRSLGSGAQTVTAASGAGAAGPIGVAIAIGGAILAGIMAGHEKRAAEAKNENSAVNNGVAGFDSDLKTINAAFNAGQMDAQTAITAAEQIMANFWAEVAPHIQPDRNGCGSGSSCTDVVNTGNSLIARNKNACNDYPGHAIGAACCTGCNALYQAIYGSVDPSFPGYIPGVIKVIQQGGGQSVIPAVYGSKYGGSARSSYTLNWTPPPAAAVSDTVSSAVDSLTQAITGSGSSAGNSSLLPLLGLGLAAFLLLR